MGFPAAVENTCAALAAGATSVGNLGQYFIPAAQLGRRRRDHHAATALTLLAAQEEEVLVHSNLDDGFAGLFTDLASVLGFVLIEKEIIEECWVPIFPLLGPPFLDPQRRLAFHLALSADQSHARHHGLWQHGQLSRRGRRHFASLANYLLVDVIGQSVKPSGHAINAVPVTENSRIPEIEIIDVQLFAGRLAQAGPTWSKLVNVEQATVAEQIAAARRFRDNVVQGLAQAGVDTSSAVEMLLAMKRLGPKRIEELWGAGQADRNARGCRPAVRAPLSKSSTHLPTTISTGSPATCASASAA